MDPDEALKNLNSALLDDDAEEADEIRKNLRAWLFRGGFQPEWHRYPEASTYVIGREGYRVKGRHGFVKPKF